MTRTHHAIAVPPAVIRRAIARALVGQARADARRATHAAPLESANTVATLGEIELFPHQRGAVAQLRGVLQQHHVAVLADEVGLGKTFVALALARGYEHACVIAPAALLPMWRAALQQAADTTTSLHSLHAYSRASRAPQWSARTHHPSVPPSRILVIIDEAHHVRRPSRGAISCWSPPRPFTIGARIFAHCWRSHSVRRLSG
jgi:superfamily II DNA or RNA helicase